MTKHFKVSPAILALKTYISSMSPNFFTAHLGKPNQNGEMARLHTMN